MAQATSEKADTDNAITNNHDGGEKGIPGQPGCFRPAGNHHRDDECYFNGCDRESQHQCAEGFADTKCDHLSMIDSGKNRGDQNKNFG